jgi:hypothetical protein
MHVPKQVHQTVRQNKFSFFDTIITGWLTSKHKS